MTYADHYAAHLRLTLLRVLDGSPACKANSAILQSAAQELGFDVSRDQVLTELAWLAEQRLLTSEDHHGVTVATLSGRGADVANGRATVPGVPRPSPKG